MVTNFEVFEDIKNWLYKVRFKAFKVLCMYGEQ